MRNLRNKKRGTRIVYVVMCNVGSYVQVKHIAQICANAQLAQQKEMHKNSRRSMHHVRNYVHVTQIEHICAKLQLAQRN